MWNPFRRPNRESAESQDPLSDSVFYTYIQKNRNAPYEEYMGRSEALAFVPYFACIDLLSQQAADVISATVKVVDIRTGDLVDTETARKCISLLRDTPDGIHSARDFVRETMADLLIEGNALVEVERGMRMGSAPRPIHRLCRLNVDDASADITDYNRGLDSVVYEATRFGSLSEMAIPIQNVVHVRLIPRQHQGARIDGKTLFSASSLKKLRLALNIGRTVDLFIKDYFDNSLKSDMVITMPEKAPEGLARKFKKFFKGYAQSGRVPLVLPEGMDAKTFKHTAQNSDVVKLRETQTMEIARFFKIPPPVIGVHTTQWGSGIEQLARLMWRYSTRLYVRLLLEEFSLKLLPRGQKFIVDPQAEIQGDTSALTAFISAVKPNTNSPGVMSLQEIRRDILGLPNEYMDDWNWQSSLDVNTMSPEARATYDRIRDLQVDFYKQYYEDTDNDRLGEDT